MQRARKFRPIPAIAGLLFATTAYSDTISTFNATGNWSDASKWTPAAVPNNSAATRYDATIAGTATLNISPTINTLTVTGFLTGPSSGAAPTLTVVHDATANGNLVFAPGLVQPPTGPAGLSVGGNLNVGSTAFFGLANEPLTVGGNLMNATPDMEVLGSGSFKVGGILTNQSGAVLRLGDGRCFSPTCPPPGFLPTLGPIGGPATSAGAMVNNGTLYSWSDISSSTFVNKGTGFFIGGGPTVGTLANGGMLSLGNACCSIAEAETAGISAGTATGRYGYSQSANGILDELLLGKSAYGTIDAIHNSSTAYPVDLNGTLDIMRRSGFVPAPGESFTIFTFSPGELSGTFSDVTWDSFDNGHGYFQVQYNNAGGDVMVTAEGNAVPEPGTLLLFAPALAWLFWATRKTALRR